MLASATLPAHEDVDVCLVALGLARPMRFRRLHNCKGKAVAISTAPLHRCLDHSTANHRKAELLTDVELGSGAKLTATIGEVDDGKVSADVVADTGKPAAQIRGTPVSVMRKMG